MQNRAFGFVAMLSVMGMSIVFGMLLGGKLNSPPAMLAASQALPAVQLTPAVGGIEGTVSFADIVERSLPAVVTVTSTARGSGANPHEQLLDDPFFRRFFGQPPDNEQPERRIGSGSGFLISADGFVLTNNHVIQDFEKVEVTTTGGRTYTAQLVGADRSIDLALLKIDAGDQLFPTLPLGDSDSLRVGEWVIAIGNPHEFDHTVTVGIVSGKERRVPLPSTDWGLAVFIQTDAAINLGNSGGPLLDARGNVIGINTAIRRNNFAEGIGFALPINQARGVVEQLREYGQVRRGYIGITMNDVPIDETAREYYGLPDIYGVLVKGVAEDGPAARAGIQRGDVIREVDGAQVRDNKDLLSKISSRAPGDKVQLGVFRRGRTLDLSVALANRAEGLDREYGRQPEPPRGEEREPEKSSGLGLTVETLDDATRQRLEFAADQRGVVITEVDLQSEADRKGLRPTMVVTAVNDERVRSASEWERAIGKLRPGSPVKLDVLAPGGEAVLYVFLRAPAP